MGSKQYYNKVVNITSETVLAIFGTLGVGGLFGSFITYILNKREYKFQMLHEKRIEVIVELYKKIVDAELAMGTATIETKAEFLGTPQERLSKASDITHEMTMYYFKNRIYLEESLAEEIKKFDLELGHVYFDLAEIEGVKNRNFEQAQEKMNKVIRPMKKSLERKLQDILGVEKSCCKCQE